MRNRRFMAFIVLAALLVSFSGICDEHDSSHSDIGGHHCMAACGVGCCKSMIEDAKASIMPSYLVCALVIPKQAFHKDIIVHSIKHPPKAAA